MLEVQLVLLLLRLGTGTRPPALTVASRHPARKDRRHMRKRPLSAALSAAATLSMITLRRW